MKKVLIGIGILVLLGLGYVVYSFSTGGKNAEEANKERNPIFHTLPEGSTCRPGEGDCAVGLSCSDDKICVKP